MARSESEIEEAIKESLVEINPSIDLEVGPTYDFLIRPIPRQLAIVEREVDRLARYYSPDFPEVATAQEIRNFALNFGVGQDVGAFAQGSIVFFRNSPPPTGNNFLISAGSIVTTGDGNLVYRASESKTMIGDFAETYFNPSTSRYEIEILISAIAPGEKYNVPSRRINKMASSIDGFDGIEQRGKVEGGSEPEDAQSLARRVIRKFKGLDFNSISGVERFVREIEPSLVRSVRVIRPTDRLEFRRPTVGPALDLCVSGQISLVFTEQYLAVGGERTFTLQRKTATSVSQVTVNGVAVENTQWGFTADPTPELRGSTRAVNKISFLGTLQTSDIVEVIGTYNALLDRLQVRFTETTEEIFQTDILVRSFVDLPIVISMEVRLKNNPNIDPTTVQENLLTVASNLIEPLEVPSRLIPEDFRERVRLSLPDVESIRIVEFRRKLTSTDTVEVIFPKKNERPKFDSVSSSITVRI